MTHRSTASRIPTNWPAVEPGNHRFPNVRILDRMDNMYGDVVEGHTRMDQLATRVERIEHRLELNDQAH